MCFRSRNAGDADLLDGGLPGTKADIAARGQRGEQRRDLSLEPKWLRRKVNNYEFHVKFKILESQFCITSRISGPEDMQNDP